MTDRHEFSTRTKRYVALRAGYHCSFPKCQRLTVGPSDESSERHVIIGEAAHICAASPGGPRYVAAMSEAQRRHIDNAIWLCVHHARLIDREASVYTIEALRKMKADHEAACSEELRRAKTRALGSLDLLAMGPNVVCLGELTAFGESEWTLNLRNFVDGDVHRLLAFVENFAKNPEFDRYVIVNALGDGRVIAAPPSVTRHGEGYLVHCPIVPSFPRIAAQELPRDLAISRHTGDLYVEGGDIATVAGLAALPQKVRTCLSTQRGESPFYPEFGARLVTYFEAFRNSPWLGQLLKMEVIRFAAIPYRDNMLNATYTPFHCVERVRSVEVLAGEPVNRWLPVRFEFEVKGVGVWRDDIPIFWPSTSSFVAETLSDTRDCGS